MNPRVVDARLSNDASLSVNDRKKGEITENP